MVVADLNSQRAAEVAEQLGGRSATCDVTDGPSVQAAVDLAAGLAAGGLRISVTCAGIGTPAS